MRDLALIMDNTETTATTMLRPMFGDSQKIKICSVENLPEKSVRLPSIKVRSKNYSNHLNTGLVWYSNGGFVFGCQMVWCSNDGLKKACFWSKIYSIQIVRHVT